MNFQLLLFSLFIITGVAYFADIFYFRKERKKNAQIIIKEYDRQLQEWQQTQNQGSIHTPREEVLKNALKQPWWLDLTAGMFPIFAVVFILRSFIAEPFKIPSGSMIPTLLPGDFILVNKYHYGLRLPIINQKIWANNNPERGDIMVFRYPVNPKVDYIKRVIGLPGDVIEYQNKRLRINGQDVSYQPKMDYYNESEFAYMQHLQENLAKKPYNIINNVNISGYISQVEPHPFSQNCSYYDTGLKCKVPEGHYFMMGDNRDNSKDSRYWGFVPEDHIVGKAFFIWLNLSQISRIGSIQ
jgi:signal peptidase I